MLNTPSSLASGSSCVTTCHTPHLFSTRVSETGRPVRLFEAAQLRHILGCAAAAAVSRRTKNVKAASLVDTAATSSLAVPKNASGSRKSTVQQEPKPTEQRQRQALQPCKHVSFDEAEAEVCMRCRSSTPDRKSNKSKPADFPKKFKTSSRAIIVQQVNITTPRV